MDAFTTTSDFFIFPHSASKGLFVPTCGSFYGYKFFLILRKCVTQMLEGGIDPELVEKWAWDRQRPDSSANKQMTEEILMTYLVVYESTLNRTELIPA